MLEFKEMFLKKRYTKHSEICLVEKMRLRSITFILLNAKKINMIPKKYINKELKLGKNGRTHFDIL